MATTKEKIVDLKAKPEAIKPEDLQILQGLVNDNNSVQFRVGAVEAQKYSLLNELSKVQIRISALQERFKEEYGTFDINLKDGTINYPEDGE